MHTSDIQTGFDLELLIRGTVFTSVLQLLQDVGAVPREVNVGTTTVAIAATPPGQVDRRYGAYPGADYVRIDPAAFAVQVHDYPSNPDWLYLSVNVGGLGMSLYLAVRRELDVRRIAADILDYVDGDSTEFAYWNDLEAVAFQLTTASFDPLRPFDQVAPIGFEVLHQVNHGISDAFRNLKARKPAGLLKFLAGQPDPLYRARVDRLRLEPFQTESAIGVYANMVLLDHARGLVPARGAIDIREFFLEDGEEMGLCSGPDFLGHIVDDLLLKAAVGARRSEESLDDDAVLAALLGEHFPLVVPRALVEELLGQPLQALTLVVRDTRVGTVNRRVESEEAPDEPIPNLKVVLELNVDAGVAFELADDNVVAFVAPLAADIDGVRAVDAFVETNLRADILRSLVDLELVPTPLNLLASAILAAVGNHTQDGSIVKGRLSELGAEMGAPTLATRRWDPFYYSLHRLVLVEASASFADERLFLSVRTALSKSFQPEDRAVVRQADPEGDALRLRYSVEDGNNWLPASEYATDREPFVQEAEDAEPNVFSLVEADAAVRVALGKLVRNVIYKPYTIVTDQDPSPNADIDLIGLYSNREQGDLLDSLKDRFRDAMVDEILDALVAQGWQIDAVLRARLVASLRPYVEEQPRYLDYVDGGTLERDVLAAIRSGPGILRLRLSPVQLDRLEREALVALPGYASVVREGKLYVRNIANETTADNLLSQARER